MNVYTEGVCIRRGNVGKQSEHILVFSEQLMDLCDYTIIIKHDYQGGKSTKFWLIF